jgi:SAM-dependent methyltransferase
MDLARLDIAADGAMRAHVIDGNGSARVEELPPDAAARALWGRNIDFAARRLSDGDYEAELPLLTMVARAALQAVRKRDSVERGVPLPSENRGSPSEVSFWQSLYERRGDGWDVARPAPPLARWFAAHPPTGERALVVGCGRGHEARMLAAAGALVTAIDFAPSAIVEARALAEREGAAITFLERDLFALASEASLRRGFDLVVEHCCFCAIDPARRDEYADVMAELLPPGGALVGLFYCHGRAGGPPFSVAEAELERHFARAFSLVSLTTPADSIATRQGDERLAVFQRRQT